MGLGEAARAVGKFSYILASHGLQRGMLVMNCDKSKRSSYLKLQELIRKVSRDMLLEDQASGQDRAASYGYDIQDLNSQVGNCMPLADIRMGTLVHSIECNPGQGAKLVRAAGTCAKVVKGSSTHCLVRLPSGEEKLVNSRCRATIGMVSNPSHGTHKLRKAGQSRWLGRRPVVRGVAMNPIDHPHGGGEGRTSGGRPSVTPWGKPTKAGYKTAPPKRRKWLT